MRDDSTMVAIEAALSSAHTCDCGDFMQITSHDGALWLECRAFAAPTRLPGRLAGVLRLLTHDRSFVAVDPSSVAVAPARDERRAVTRTAAAPA